MIVPYIGNFIIPTDEVIFFKGVGIPPTIGSRYSYWYCSLINFPTCRFPQRCPKVVVRCWLPLISSFPTVLSMTGGDYIICSNHYIVVPNHYLFPGAIAMLANAGISDEAYEAAIQACVKTSTGSAAVCQMRSAAYLFPDHTEGPIVPIKTVDEVHGHIIALAAIAVRDAPVLFSNYPV